MSNSNSPRKSSPEAGAAPDDHPAFDEITADDTIPAGFGAGSPAPAPPYERSSSGLRVRVNMPKLGGPWFAGLEGLARSTDGSERGRRQLREELATRLGLGIGGPERDRVLCAPSSGLSVSPTPLPVAEQQLEWLLVCLLSQDSCEVAIQRLDEVPPAILVALGVLGGRAIHGSTSGEDQPLLDPSERVYASRLNAWLGLYGLDEEFEDRVPESASPESVKQLRELAGEQATRRLITSPADFVNCVDGLHLDRAVSLRIE